MKRLSGKTLLASAISMAVVGTANAEFELEEVLVTATRRAESVQDVPYNISAVQGDDLAVAGVTDIGSLASRIPGISYTDRGARGGAFNSGIAMRGLSVEDGRLSGPVGTAPAVGTYVGETPLFVNLRLTDIDRVEVLRGPQGTLYGSGSMGGTLRFIQAQPSLEDFEAEISGDLGQTKNGERFNNSTDVMLNIPLSETLALRANLGRSDDAGWIDRPRSYVMGSNGQPAAVDPANANPGVINATRFYTGVYTFEPVLGAGSNVGSEPLYREVEGTNDEKSVTGRLALLWAPNEEFEALLTYQVQDDESHGNPIQAVDHPDYDEYESPSLIEEPFDGKTEVLSLDMTHDLGFASVTGSLSHYETEQAFSGEQTEFYKQFSFYSYTYGFMPRPLVTYEDENNDEGDVVELRLSSQTDGPIDWVVGLFYMDQDTEIVDKQFFPGYQDWADACAAANPSETDPALVTGACGAGTTLGTYMAPLLNQAFYVGGPQAHPNADAAGVTVEKDNVFIRDMTANFTDKAFFGELTWHITDTWQVTGGWRHFKQEFDSSQVNAAVLVDSVDRSARGFEEKDTLFKFNTSWDIDDSTMLYFTWSEGFRRGGANPIPSVLTSFGTPYATAESSFEYAPDKVTNTEIGIKGHLGNRFQYTLSYYDIEWEDIQLDTNTTIFSFPTVLNMGEARSRGVELEFSGNLTENLEMTLGYSYADAELTDPDAEAAEIAIGDPFNSPTAADLTTQVATGNAASILKGTDLPGVSRNTLSLDLAYYQELDNGMSLLYDINGTYRSKTSGELDPTVSTTADSYQMWNAFISLDSGEAWTARLYVDNILDEIGVINSANLSDNGPRRSQIISRPRTVGFGLSYTF